jgi:DNA modification methylase
MTIPVVNSRELKNTWRILDDKIGNFRDRGLPFKIPYVGAFSQSVAEWFLRVYSNVGDTVIEPFGGRGTTAMQALWHERNIIINDLSPYSNVLCHSILFTPYMRDVLIFINILEEHISSNRCNVSTDYAGKGSDNDVAKLYHEKTFDKIIKLRNILNSRDVLLGFREDLFGEIGYEYKDDQKMFYTYRHEIVMFARLVMSQLMLHSSQEMSFNGIKTRGTDNTYIKGILRYYGSLGESPKDVNIFVNMRHYVNHMGLDELGVRNKFGRLSRKLISCDARKLDLPDKCADIVVTSPPYYANLNYGMANWLRIMAIGGIGDPLIGNHINTEKLEKDDNSEIYGKTYDRITDRAGGTVDNPMSYSGFTGQYLHELYRVLKDDAVAIIVVGDYGNKRKVEAWRLVTDRAEIFGFKPAMVIMDELNKQTKSSTQFQAKHDGGKNDYDVCVVLFKGNYKQKNNPEDLDFRWGSKFVDGNQLDIESAWGNI